MRSLQTIAFAVMFSIAVAGVSWAQQPPAANPPAALSEVSSLKVTVVVSRYQGEKKLSSFPYSLSVTADGRQRAELKMGSQIPVTVAVQGTPSTVFKDVGTSVSCIAISAGVDRFKLDLNVSDSSVYDDTAKLPNGGQALGALQPLRSFSSSNTLILKDGQSSQFTTGTDRLTGEVTKVDVTLAVAR